MVQCPKRPGKPLVVCPFMPVQLKRDLHRFFLLNENVSLIFINVADEGVNVFRQAFLRFRGDDCRDAEMLMPAFDVF